MSDDSRATDDVLRGVIDQVQACVKAPPDEAKATFGHAMARLVRCRNRAIARTQAPAQDRALRDLNAVLSLMVGIEFPLMGLHRERMEQVTRALQRMRETRP